MKFFKKLKEKLFSTSSKLEGGLESIIEPKRKVSETSLASENNKKLQSQVSGSSERTRENKKLIKEVPLTPEKKKPSLFGKIISSVGTISRRRKLDEAMLTDLEDLLITSDIGVSTSSRIVEAIRKENYSKELDIVELKQLISDEIYNIMKASSDLPKNHKGKLNIWLFVGVNGSGKTTTIGKIANQEKAKGRKVIIAAADTFRAAAVDQLSIWGTRSGVPVVKGEEKSDPASVVIKAIEKAQDNESDLLLIDTAGRLQNKSDLMLELEKIIRVIKKKDNTAPHNNILVLDATSGQNIHSQVDIFSKSAGVTGIIMTKLDGTAKGGILLAIGKKFKLPIIALGMGEKETDLHPFNAEYFAKALLGFES